jgi:rhamnosyltransferase
LSFFAFWPLLKNKVLIVNPDGCEWRRTKWSSIGRVLISAMYWPALSAAHHIVIDAEALRGDFGSILGKKSRYIGYQAPSPKVIKLNEITKKSLSLNRPFFLIIARLEPENNIEMILKAFNKWSDGSIDLIIVGSTVTQYYKTRLLEMTGPNVRFLGAIYDQNVLQQLRSNCIVYLHGHSVGGTNPSLLEALAEVRGRIYCHENKYNHEVASGQAAYFRDDQQLIELFDADYLRKTVWPLREPTRDQRFRSDIIAAQYLSLFKEIRAAY